jgi:hypothetical protein
VGFSRNVGGPVVSISGQEALGGALPKPPGLRTGVGFDRRNEDRREGWYRQAKETKCGGMGVRES